nr:hypothetical protein [Tanacetum cinerariifolium]
MEYFVKISKKAYILELKQSNLKNVILTSNTRYPSRNIWRIHAFTSQENTKNKDQYAVSRRLPYVEEVPPKTWNDMPPRDKQSMH